MHEFIAKESDLCHPEKIFICSDSAEDIAYVRKQAIATGEEKAILTMEGHTVHFDGEQDQGRDRANTKYLVPKGVTFSKALNQMDRQEGLAEVTRCNAGYHGGQNHDCPLHRIGTNKLNFHHFGYYNALIHGMLPTLKTCSTALATNNSLKQDQKATSYVSSTLPVN